MSTPGGAAHAGPKWHQHLTIDLICDALTRSICHPFVAWTFPLCVRALGAPYTSLNFLATCAYAGVITLAWILSVVNHRIAYGVPRPVDWNEEVVVITGGSSGLGRVLAEMYGMRGASVAVLDVQPPGPERLVGATFYECDVSDPSAVGKTKDRIEEDLGVTTVLINNAAIVNGKPLLDLTNTQIDRSFGVNCLAPFYLLKAFLPGMLKSEVGGTIVTISSVLGKLGASHLSDYTAAKAALIAMHASLRAELSSPTAPAGAENIRTVLVTPGQLSTPSFAGVETPSRFFAPIVEPVELAREIVRIIDAGESGRISMPLYARWIEWMHVLPVGGQSILRMLSGIDAAMEKKRSGPNGPSSKSGG